MVAEMTGSEARLFSFKVCLSVAAWVFVAACGLSPTRRAGAVLRRGHGGAADSAAALLGSGRPAACGVFLDRVWNLCPLH